MNEHGVPCAAGRAVRRRSIWRVMGRSPQAKVSKRVLNGLKRVAAHLPLTRQARLVRRVLPRSLWFKTAVAMARAQGGLVARMGGNGPFTTALMLDFWLRELSFGGEFPIPYRVTGADVVRSPGPKLYTWTHLPLTEVPLRVGLEQGGESPAVVADPGNIVGENEVLVVGWTRRVEAIPADDQLLLRVRSKLAAGRPVVFLADQFLGGPLSDVPLRLAARLRVPVVFQWAELAQDGVIEVTFQFAPESGWDEERGIAANVQFLRERNRAALQRLGWGG